MKNNILCCQSTSGNIREKFPCWSAVLQIKTEVVGKGCSTGDFDWILFICTRQRYIKLIGILCISDIGSSNIYNNLEVVLVPDMLTLTWLYTGEIVPSIGSIKCSTGVCSKHCKLGTCSCDSNICSVIN